MEGYKQINNSINQIFAKKNNDIIAEHELKTLKAYYVCRVLKCLYDSDILIPAKKRLKVIRSLDCSVIDYAKNGDTIQWKVLKWLLRHRLYSIYDGIKFISTQLKVHMQKNIFLLLQ